MYIRVELDFLKNFINISQKVGINDSAMREASLLSYGNENASVAKFYGGLSEILSAIEDNFDAELENVNLSSFETITEKVGMLLKMRIYGNGDRLGFYKELGNFYLSKAGYSYFFQNSYKTVDKIWRVIGDNSMNWRYYSKRAILFGIYCSSMRYYIKSPACSIENLEDKINQKLKRLKVFNKLKKMMSPSNIPFIRLLRK